MTSLAPAPRQPVLDVRGRGPVAAVPANVNKQYLSVPFDQLIAQQSLLRVQLQLDRCQQLDIVTSAYHYRSSSSRLSTSDRCGIESMRRATCSLLTASTFSVWRKRGTRTLTMFQPHHIRALQSIDSFKAALKTYLFDCSSLNPAETVRQSSTVWLTRALVTSLSCYGALEIVGLLLLFCTTLS